jgi:ribosomal protein S12 methylthiotransferase accessory factor
MEMKIYFPGNLRVHADYKGFTVETDQPIAAGGDGSAPAPFDYFMVSIGACAGIFMLSFMRQRGIDPAGSGVTMRTERGDGGMVGNVELVLQLPAGFPEKYEGAIVRAVEQCSVKRHLATPPTFSVVTER